MTGLYKTIITRFAFENGRKKKKTFFPQVERPPEKQVIGSKAPDIAQTTSILSRGADNHAGSYLKLPHFLVKSSPQSLGHC